MNREQTEHRERGDQGSNMHRGPKMSRRMELWKKGIKLLWLEQERRKKQDKIRLDRQLLEGSSLHSGSLGEEVHMINLCF